MRINRFVAVATGLSRRAADTAIAAGRVRVNGQAPVLGQEVGAGDSVMFDGRHLARPLSLATVILNKPAGYVCSRRGQGSKTIYDLLPPEFHHLKPVGRLDKDSSGLLLLTDDGELANRLTHPRFHKTKRYEVTLDRELAPEARRTIEQGVQLPDGLSHLHLAGAGKGWTITMHEGRNRQIRRTFAALGYKVVTLHRILFGPYRLQHLETGTYAIVNSLSGQET